MRKVVVIIFALLLMQVSGFTSYAGTVNSQEVRVIESASGFFDNLGESYQPTDEALAHMKAYLNQDAIAGGYIIPVQETTDNGKPSPYQPVTNNLAEPGFIPTTLLIPILLIVTFTSGIFADENSDDQKMNEVIGIGSNSQKPEYRITRQTPTAKN